jgi:YebC/PmpR family DNA-binding regulatory protein
LNGRKTAGLSFYEILTLASIIEKESGSGNSDVDAATERKLIAGIFYNRLSTGQALESDATINYVTGELEGAAYEELVYEGYAPGGVALLIECTSDNRNRTRGEVHTIMAKNGGSLGAPNSVAWMFKAKGVIIVKKEVSLAEDRVMESALDLGAEDFKSLAAEYEIYTSPMDLNKVKDGLISQKMIPATAEVVMIPDNLVPVGDEDAPKVLKLMELLEALEDVKNVYGNFDISDAVMEKLAA